MVDVPEKKGSRRFRMGLFGSGTSENARRADEEARRLEEEDALNQIGKIAASSSGLCEVGLSIGDQVCRVLPFDRMSLTVLEPETSTMSRVFAIGVYVSDGGNSISGTIAERAVAKRSSVLERGKSPEELANLYPALKAAIATGIRTLITVPMVVDEQVVAVLEIASLDPKSYLPQHLSLAESIADRIAPSVASSMRYAKLQRKVKTAEALAEIGRVVGQPSSITEACHLFTDKLRKIISFESFALGRPDHQADTWTTVHVSGDCPFESDSGGKFVIAGTFIEAVASSRSGLIHGSSEVETMNSRMTVPMVYDNELVAILSFRTGESYGYSKSDLALAERIAAQVAGIFRNRWSHGYQQKKAETIDRLAEIDKLMASPLKMEVIYERFARKVRTLIKFDRFLIALLDREASRGSIVFTTGIPLADRVMGATYPADEDTFQQLVGAYSGVLANVGSAAELSAKYSKWQFLATDEIRSLLAAPLIFKDQVIGALVLCSSKSNAYDQNDLVLARRVGTQVSGSIVNDQLLVRLQQQTVELEALSAIRRVLSSATEIEGMYDYVAERIQRIVPFDHIDIATVDLDEKRFVRRFTSGMQVEGVIENQVGLTDGTIVEEVIRSRSLVNFQTQLGQEETSGQWPTSLTPYLKSGLRSMAITTLVSGNIVVGVLTLASSKHGAYTLRQLDLIERLGFQLSGPMASVGERAGQIPNSRELALLNEIARLVNSSVDIGSVYESFALEVRKLISFDRIVLWTFDLQRENLFASHVYGSDLSDVKPGMSFPVDSLEVDKIYTPQRLTVNESDSAISNLIKLFPQLMQAPQRSRLPAILLVPLVAGKETVGMLSLRSPAPDHYSDRDLEIAQRIASQISGAVSNARIYLECRELEQAVREVIERLEMAVDGSGDGLWDWKISENEIWWSPGMKELLGDFERGANVAVHGLESRIHPEDKDQVISNFTDHLKGRGPYSADFRLLTDSGRYDWVNDQGQAIWDESGNLVRMSGSLRRFNRKKQGIGIEGSTLIIENLRQSLAKTHSETYSADPGVPIDYWTDAVSQASKLLLDLRTLSGVIESKLVTRSVSVTSTARAVVKQLRKNHPKRRITFSIEKDMMANADPGMLRIVIEKLLDNAWKFTSKEQNARVKMGVVPVAGVETFYVRDNGVGFDMSQRTRMFHLFQRLHTAEEFEGAGIGLFTVERIVQMHGGMTSAESEVGEGATFYFSL